MAVAIRLRRTGAKKRPFYRIVVADSSKRLGGQYIDSVGHYNPITNPKELEVDADKAIAWLGKGAKPTETVRSLFAQAGVYAKLHGQPEEETIEEAAEEAAEETAEE